MKANKFFAAAMAALMMVGFASCNKDKGGTGTGETPAGAIVLTPASATLDLKENKTVTIKANKSVKWSVISQTKSITINVEEGAEVVVTAVKEGAATLIASEGADQEFCQIVVKGEGGSGPKDPVKLAYSEIYPFILDAVTYEANKDKVVADFRVDDDNNKFYIWPDTGDSYTSGEAQGLNSYGQEGYFALTVGKLGWSGGGICMTDEAGGSNIDGVNELIKKIVAEPDKYFFHIALKSTDNANHMFTILNAAEKSEIVIGKGPMDVSNDKGVKIYTLDPVANFARLGAWEEIDVPLTKVAEVLAGKTFAKGDNVFTFTSGSTTGVQLNMDAAFVYKK